jgi:transcription-repair coupling factor (superfamily II helicase)
MAYFLVAMKTLNNVLSTIAAHPSLASLAGALEVPCARLRIAPLIVAGRVPTVAALSLQYPAPIVLITGSTDNALRAYQDLRLWLGPERLLLFPPADVMPYEHMAPSDDALGRRLSVLEALRSWNAERQSDAATVVVTSIKALLQPTLMPNDLAYASTTLHIGQHIEQETLLRHWTEIGYRVATTVEAVADLSRRGDIVDIWPPAAPQPLRIEWFGDEIDSLRSFDPISQRSDQRTEEVTIGPASELPLWRREAALQRIQAYDTHTLREEARREWETNLTRIELGDTFDGLSFYAPFFRWPAAEFRSQDSGIRRSGGVTSTGNTPSALHSLLSHLPENTLLALNDQQQLAQYAADYDEQAENQRFRLIEAAELLPDFPRPYLRWDELALADCRLRIADMSNNELLDNDPGLSAQFAAPTFVAPELFGGQFRRLVADIVARLQRGERIIAVTNQAARLQELVQEEIRESAEYRTENRELRTENQGTREQTNAEDRTPSTEHSVQNHELRTRNQTFVAVYDDTTTFIQGTIDAGFRMPELGLTLYTDTEIFGLRQRRPLVERRRRKLNSVEERAAFLRGLKAGDYVVHIEHGIAVFEGMLHRTVGEIEREYLSLRYAGGDRIYVPIDQIDRVARYIGAGDSEPQLTRLGTQEWERAKRKARQAVQDLADDLLKIYAQRQLKTGYAFSADNEWQRELEASFPYIETNDQLRALVDVKHDMEEPQPMDRLICGDVGFGKTEVALRAAFKAVQDGKQVAVLVPTTVLAQQHFDTFTKRMASFPVTIEMLSRFRSPKEQDAILRELAKGNIDIIIGTHRLLSKDVSFRDLGLVIVDEEQRFGVRHKERLKQLRAEVDVLTLTATPIPRTLHMAMAGIRDLSVIDTPPEDRVPIKTYVMPYSDAIVREAIAREIERDGQIYFVHNRVQSVYHVASHIKTLVPEASVAVGHGQLDERELERVMFDFFEGRYDVLVCTTIIESGLDIPNANTIIIDDATNYGLAQLYQLRGRVGRSSNRAYAYLLYKPEKRMTGEAQQRLEAIQEATELGAGFRVAMRDLEIRGAGNLLGAEQSGHIAAVGFDLYTRLLEQAVTQLKASVDAGRQRDGETGQHDAASDVLSSLSNASSKLVVNEKVLVAPLVTLDLPLTAYLPPEYIPDDTLRLVVYQRMVEVQTIEEIRGLRQELRDRFGEPPAPAVQLLTWLHIKALALNAGVSAVTTSDDEFIVRLPILDGARRERLRRRYGRDASVKVGPQFIRLDRRAIGEAWSDKLMGVLEVMAA